MDMIIEPASESSGEDSRDNTRKHLEQRRISLRHLLVFRMLFLLYKYFHCDLKLRDSQMKPWLSSSFPENLQRFLF